MASSPGPKCLRTISPVKPAQTDPGNEADERHGWRLSQHQSRPASQTQPGPDRRDLEYQEMEADGDYSHPASLPELAGAQP